jgi:hypothetical protein
MMKLINISRGQCSIDSMCIRLHPGESLEFGLTADELRVLHPDIMLFVEAGHMVLVNDQPQEESAPASPPPADPQEPVTEDAEEAVVSADNE